MTFAVDLNGPAAGTGYDRLAVANQVSIGNAYAPGHARLHAGARTPRSPSSTTPAPLRWSARSPGCRRTRSLFVDGHPFRISYTGGDGNDVVLTALAQPAFSISDVTVTEGESGSVNAVFTVSTPHRAVPDRRRAVRDRERHGGEPAGLHRAQRHADVPCGHDESDRDDLGAWRRHRRSDGNVHRAAVRRARRRDDRRRGRRRHDRDRRSKRQRR